MQHATGSSTLAAERGEGGPDRADARRAERVSLHGTSREDGTGELRDAPRAQASAREGRAAMRDDVRREFEKRIRDLRTERIEAEMEEWAYDSEERRRAKPDEAFAKTFTRARESGKKKDCCPKSRFRILPTLRQTVTRRGKPRSHKNWSGKSFTDYSRRFAVQVCLVPLYRSLFE
jgi:hypothetical protein